MIEIRNVVKEFDGFRALDGLNMPCPTERFTGLSARTEPAKARSYAT